MKVSFDSTKTAINNCILECENLQHQLDREY